MLALPEFPSQKKLELSDKETIEALVDQFLPYSDFNFTSMLCWDFEDNFRVSQLNNNLVVQFQSYVDDNKFIGFIGKSDVTETAKTLLRYLEQDGLDKQLHLIPEIVAEQIDQKGFDFKIIENPEDNDYIVPVENLTALSGALNHVRARRIRRFKEACPGALLVPIDLQRNREEVLNLFNAWQDSKKLEEIFVERERSALIKLLDNSRYLDVTPMGLIWNEKLIGFSIFEFISDDFVIGHFEKANHSINGSSQFLQYEVGRYLQGKGVKLFNLEQDLGLIGLKISKSALRPSMFLKKYTVEMKKGSS